MYLIKKVGFDSLENCNPICEEIIGVIDCDEKTASDWIRKNNPKANQQYEGWDGKKYPYYTKTPINIIKP